MVWARMIDVRKLSMKRIMKLSKHKLVILMLMGTICLILPVQSRADKKPDEVKIPQSIYPGLHHFFDLVDPEKNDDWDYFYSNILKKRYIGDNHNGKKWLPKLLADKDHWSGMSREEMESALVIEYMKAVIGKTPTADIEKLLEF